MFANCDRGVYDYIYDEYFDEYLTNFGSEYIDELYKFDQLYGGRYLWWHPMYIPYTATKLLQRTQEEWTDKEQELNNFSAIKKGDTITIKYGMKRKHYDGYEQDNVIMVFYKDRLFSGEFVRIFDGKINITGTLELSYSPQEEITLPQLD